ncbi:hypothetical protein CC85DRAFT_289085 [Cutaneotrichosporon oleaginosum]|uniref:Uncharacterized protein n=1 Tax=Cutaneotrichosporon oleaginosum TaxID=879819 RepID=A0A0J0XCW0_9TREE|nr:uncharacterized protein CC85DRAFT_289085 [Cutaneotrichosporon oleaginosum]KLT38893.1 hypothetical protein CC85DRAFT_289085 [Cutaneotrichosporon oleaginosum]TXT10374.1 hypothetical protein COLE_04308 [Cutaneotrichosporon oleaginosum]
MLSTTRVGAIAMKASRPLRAQVGLRCISSKGDSRAPDIEGVDPRFPGESEGLQRRSLKMRYATWAGAIVAGGVAYFMWSGMNPDKAKQKVQS